MYNKKILIIGSTPHAGIGKTYGGTTILMQSFLDYCKANNVPYHFIQANKYLGVLSGLRNYIYVIIQFILNIWSAHIVMVNSALRGAFFLSPFIYFLSRLLKKKVVLRKFGGNFHQIFHSSPKWKQILLKYTILKADALFFETLAMVDYFQNYVTDRNKVQWFPNVRQKPLIEIKTKTFRRKVVFISHIKTTKGVLEIIAATESLPEEYTVDLFGPIMDNAITVDSFKGKKANYRGVLSPEKVIPSLNEYDVLLLPTFHPGEGYPGIIIESLSLGIPVISTYWNAVPEIIQHEENGLLIPIKDSDALLKAIISINEDNYKFFSINAKKSFERFHDRKVYYEVIQNLMNL